MDRMSKAYAKDKEAKAAGTAAGKEAKAAAAASKPTTGGKRKLQQTKLDVVGGS